MLSQPHTNAEKQILKHVLHIVIVSKQIMFCIIATDVH